MAASVTRINNWCIYCVGQKLCEDNSCKYCFNKSLASYKGLTSNGKLRIDCWHPTKNKNIKPRNIAKGSDKKCWFTCDQCNHDFCSIISGITCHNKWCSHCTNKTELILYKWLLKNKNIKEVHREYKPKWCSTEYKTSFHKKIIHKRYQYRYDFLITFHNNNNLIIELDGRQHFEQIKNWKTPFSQQIRDKYKEFKAKKYKIPLIRCCQRNVFQNKNNWKNKLLKQFTKYKK